MVEKTFLEQLQELAQQQKTKRAQESPELKAGVHEFTILGGKDGLTPSGYHWTGIEAQHSNGSKYLLFYNLYWALKEGQLSPQLNLNTFNWIQSFDPNLLKDYKENNFNTYFNNLKGRTFNITYTTSKTNKVVIDYQTLPVEVTAQKENEEIISVDDINFDALE